MSKSACGSRGLEPYDAGVRPGPGGQDQIRIVRPRTIHLAFHGGGGPWSVYRTALGLPLVNGAGLGAGARSSEDEFLVIDGNGKVGGIMESAKSHVDIVHAYTRM